MEQWKKYQKAMWKRAVLDTSDIYGGIVNMMIAQFIAIPLGYAVSQFSRDNAGIWPQISGAIIALLPILGMILFQRVLAPIKIWGEQTKLLELKEYDDLDIVYSPLAETLKEKRESYKTHIPTESQRLSYVIINKGLIRIKNCRIIMTDLKLQSRFTYSESTENLSIENKSFRWNNSEEERIDIGAKSREPFVLAKKPDTNAFAIFNFVTYKEDNDISSRIPRVFEGVWKATVQLEGRAEKTGIDTDLDPVLFTISFDFSNQRLSHIEVIKHKR